MSQRVFLFYAMKMHQHVLIYQYRRYGIGFCDERTPLGGIQLGWENTSWGYHGDDAAIYHGNYSRGTPFGDVYGKDDVIGCGVNFAQHVAFYTQNGEIIGQQIQSPSYAMLT